MHMEITGLPICLFMAFFVPAWVQGNPAKQWWRKTSVACEWKNQGEGKTGETDVGGEGLFENWGFMSCFALALTIAQNWLGGLVCKKFSTVVKTIAKSFSLILTVFATELFFKECWAVPLHLDDYMVSIIVFCGTVLFSLLPKVPVEDTTTAERTRGRRDVAGLVGATRRSGGSEDVELRSVPQRGTDASSGRDREVIRTSTSPQSGV